MLNKAMIIGRIGQDPELRYSQAGLPMLNLSVATDESYTDRDGSRQEKTEWHRVAVYDRQAENCATYLHKGSLVFVEGRLQTRKWQDSQGQERQTTEIRAQRVQFLDRKGDGAGAAGEPPRQGAPNSRKGGYNPNPPTESSGPGKRQGAPQSAERQPQPRDFDAGGAEMDEVPFA